MGDSTHDDEEMLLAMNDEDDDGGGGDDGGGDDGGDYGGDDDDGGDDGGDDDGGDDDGDEEEGDDEEEEGDDEEEEEDEDEDEEEGDDEDEEDEEDEDEEDDEDEESDDEEDEDEDEEDDEEEASAGGDGGDDDGGDDDGGDGDDDDDDGEDEDDDDLEVVEDEEIYASEDDFPNATEEDFADDDGEWSDDDYEESAERLFGDHEHYGETAEEQWAAEGYEMLDEAEEQQYLAPIAARAPAAAKSVRFVKSGGQLAAKGFVSIVVLQQIRKLYPKADYSGLHVTVPAKREPKKGKIRKLPGKLNKIVSKKGVDLRKFSTPVGDQKQTMRCSAFAWTHAVEMVARMKGKDYPRLSPSYTMLQFQKFQGDYQDFAWAAAGGEGTVGGTGPGEVLMKNGTCKGDLWPDDDQQPKANESAMQKDAARYKLEAKLWEVKLEDLKKVLSAGYPVHVSMNTGEQFSKVGRDGKFSAAEAPSGDHGRHAMLLVGYTGNYYIIKNSWGTSWGDGGYCYIPKKVLAGSDPRFVAIGVKK